MKTKTNAAVALSPDSAAWETPGRKGSDQLRITSNRGAEPKPWVCNEASDVICLLEILTGDVNVTERNPSGVIDAAKNCRDLLYEHEIEMLGDWLCQAH